MTESPSSARSSTSWGDVDELVALESKDFLATLLHEVEDA